MKANDFFRKIFSFGLWANLLSMLVVTVALCFIVKVGIDLYTHHGEKIAVPDVRHKNFADAEHLLAASELKVVVSDTGYVKNLPPDCILEQTPEAGRVVKSGRVVYVVINSSHSPMVSLPDIIDNCSYREARAKLMAMGFKVGEPQLVPGEKDWVYGVVSKGRHLQNGQRVSVNDVICIQVGDGLMDDDSDVMFADPYGYGDSIYYHHGIDPDGGNAAPDDAAPDDEDDFEVVNGPE